jgi:hypothetical protein
VFLDDLEESLAQMENSIDDFEPGRPIGAVFKAKVLGKAAG